jgi:hypothetical protein
MLDGNPTAVSENTTLHSPLSMIVRISVIRVVGYRIWQKISHGCNRLSLFVYVKVLKKGLLKEIWSTPRLTEAGSQFLNLNISANSCQNRNGLKGCVLCNGPMPNQFNKKIEKSGLLSCP